MIKQKADAAGFRDVSEKCLETVALEYARHLTSKQYRASTSTVTMAQFEDSLCRNTTSEAERHWIRGRVFAGMADMLYHRGDLSRARECYRAATKYDPWMLKVQVKKLLLSLGRPGEWLREVLRRGYRSGITAIRSMQPGA